LFRTVCWIRASLYTLGEVFRRAEFLKYKKATFPPPRPRFALPLSKSVDRCSFNTPWDTPLFPLIPVLGPAGCCPAPLPGPNFCPRVCQDDFALLSTRWHVPLSPRAEGFLADHFQLGMQGRLPWIRLVLRDLPLRWSLPDPR